jgi:O-antigen/teichoic acid export membrane protein
MADNAQNAKRLAKNTILLYVRMFISMIIGLYTSRVILDTLGVEDYGIYNVVGGLVGMFGIITSTLNTAINRFLTFELGREDMTRLHRVFSTSITIQIILSIIVVVIAETIGVWYINNIMVLAPERLEAANWCFQFSIFTAVLGLIIVPYNSAIIAHERMSIYAYLGIFTSLFALGIAFAIAYSPIDRLVFYGFLLMMSTVITFLVNVIYCHRNFSEARFSVTLDREMLGTMFGFSAWNFIGAGSGILRDYGGNLLINFYCGPAVNAARGLSNSVNHAITNFSNNFTMALNPQITKSYASGDRKYLDTLIYRGSKLSVFLLLFISAPVLLNTPFILGVWLKDVPEHTVLFTQLIIIYTMIEKISGPLVTTMLATGKIRNYQIVVGGIQCLNIPLAWLLLHYGAMPEIIVIVSIFIAHCCFAARLYMLKGMINLDAKAFFVMVYLNIVIVATLGLALPLAAHLLLPDGVTNFFVTSTLCVGTMGFAMLYVGCNKSERAFIFNAIRKFLQRFKHHKA